MNLMVQPNNDHTLSRIWLGHIAIAQSTQDIMSQMTHINTAALNETYIKRYSHDSQMLIDMRGAQHKWQIIIKKNRKQRVIMIDNA